MKLRFNKPMLDLNDESIPGETLGQRLSGFLAGATKGDAIKMFEWARTLYKNEVLDLDTSDQKKLNAFISEHEGISNILKAQCLEVMDKKESPESFLKAAPTPGPEREAQP